MSPPVSKVGWLIETNHIDGTPWWWNGKLYDDDDWTKDSLAALAFASKEDAEKIIHQIGWTTVTATEHRWGQAMAGSAPSSLVAP